MNRSSIARWLFRDPLWRAAIEWIARQGVPAYLVGGTVRDALLGRPSGDLDLAIDGAAMPLARRLADALGGAYVPLDAERDVARVVLRTPSGQVHIDCAHLRAPTIEDDLWDRDFTVNAIAARVGADLKEIIDPTGGRGDLDAGLLRAVTSHAFEHDPTRVLRLVRQRGMLGFSVVPATVTLAQKSAPALVGISGERVRDEVIQVLALPDAAEGLRYAEGLGVWDTLLPEVAPDRRELAYRRIACWEARFGPWMVPASSADHAMLAADRAACDAGDATGITKYRREMVAHWREVLSSERPRWVCSKLAAFLIEIEDGRVTERVLRRLKLSAHEIQFVAHALTAARALPQAGDGVSARVAIHRYYRRAGSAGLDGALLVWCDAQLGGQGSPAHAEWARSGAAALEAWFEVYHEMVEPPPLISGRDLIDGLGIAPGPAMGRILDRVREAQVDGLVTSREQALVLASALVDG